MAKKDTSYTYKDAEINLEEGLITEHADDKITTHDLWQVLKEIEANGRQTITIKTNKSFDGQVDGE